MMNARAFLLPLLPLAFTACATATVAKSPAASRTPLAIADVTSATGQKVGHAVVSEVEGGQMALQLTLNDIPEGEHGLHFHTTGKCDAPGFTTAGGHLNPTMHQHGKDNPAGPHLGDLPNITATKDGLVKVSLPLTGSRAELAQALMDGDGTALVVHATADDYRTDPSGNSGNRIACGVLKTP
jgi:Cu-Zn family superoxide dismutase